MMNNGLLGLFMLHKDRIDDCYYMLAMIALIAKVTTVDLHQTRAYSASSSQRTSAFVQTSNDRVR